MGMTFIWCYDCHLSYPFLVPGSNILDRELLVAKLCKLCGMVLLLIIFFAKVDINYASSAVMFSLAARLHDFSVTIPRCYKNVFLNSFFLHTARPWNSLPIGCFPLIYDLNGFKSRVNRHLLTAGSFWGDFLYPLILLCFFFL